MLHKPMSLLSFSIFEGILISKTPVEYNVLLNAGSVTSLTSSVGHCQSTVVENLAPFTQYEIRIQACQNGESFRHLSWAFIRKYFILKNSIKKESILNPNTKMNISFLICIGLFAQNISA